MRRPLTKRNCKHCQAFFDPDPRCARRQRHCSKPACRQASKAVSQRRWHQKPHNRDSFRDPTHVARVRQWRKAHPGSWRRQGSRVPNALQDDLAPQETQKQQLDDGLTPHALQDVFFMQPAVVVGLIAHLTGLALQDDIAATARRLPQLGRAILAGSSHHPGGLPNAHPPPSRPRNSDACPASSVGWISAWAVRT
jgi:hypothetical protein